MDLPVRVFVAIPVPSSIRQRLSALKADMEAIRWVGEQNIHLTLKFIGEVALDRVEGIQRALRSIEVKPFLLAVQGMGVFPGRGNPKVLWAGFGSAHPRLFQLHQKVNDTLFAEGIEPDRRVYRPHITLGRCADLSRESLKPFLKKHDPFETAPFRVERFDLLRSELRSSGAVYECLESFPLQK